MDYEKLYKEALERARDLHDNHPLGQPQTWITCEKIFPELKENEDERIRAELLDYINGFIPHTDMDLIKKSKSWIAWLEKQGEQKVINEYNEHEPTSYEIEKWNEAYEKGYNIGYINGKNEQKPTEIAEMEQIKWSEEDYNAIETIACHLDNTDNEDIAEVLRNIRDKYYLFKNIKGE